MRNSSWTDQLRRMTILSVLATLLVGLLTLQSQERVKPSNVKATLKGHTEPVYSVAYSPDGKYVVTASFDQTLKIWDTTTGKEFASFGGSRGHQKMVLNVAVSPDGRRFASGGVDNKAFLWDFPTDKPLKILKSEKAMTSVAISPDQKKLAGGSSDGTIKIWNTADGKELFVLKGHTAKVTSLGFNSNGQTLASASDDGTVRFWSTTTGKSQGVLGAHSTPIARMIPHPSFTAVYTTGNDGMLKFWQLPYTVSRTLTTPHKDTVTSVALAVNGAYVVSGSTDKTVKISNLSNGSPRLNLTGPKDKVHSVAAARNNAYVAGGTKERVYLWNLSNGRPYGDHWAHDGDVTATDFHPSSTQLATGGTDGFLRIWSLPPTAPKKLTHPAPVTSAMLVANGTRFITGGSDKILRTYTASNLRLERQYTGHQGPITAVALSPNNAYLASGSEDKTIRFWNQANGQEIAQLGAHEDTITSLSFNAASSQLLSASKDGTMKLWQMPLVAPRMFAHPAAINCAVLTPDGARMVTGCADKQVRIWNLSNGAQERAFGGSTLAILSVAVNSNASQIAGGGADKSIIVWNAANAQVIKKIANLSGAVHSLTFSRDNKTVVAGLSDNTIRVYDLATGKETKKLAGHAGIVTGLAFTPKNELISSSADKTIRVWTLATGKARTITHGASVHALSVSKDGSKVVSGASDKTAKVWNLADGKLLSTITTPAEVKSASFSPDAKRVLLGGSDNHARLYEISGGLLESSSHKGAVLAALIHNDGKRMITASADKTVVMRTSAFVRSLRHDAAVNQAIFNAQGTLLISGSADKTVKIWNASTGQVVKSIPTGAAVNGVGINSAGTLVVSIGADKSLQIWSSAATKPGAAIAPITKVTLDNLPSSIAFSGDGKRIAVGETSGKTGRACVYDASTGVKLSQVASFTAPVSTLTFHTDNLTLLSASEDRTVRLDKVNGLNAIKAHEGGVVDVQFDNTGNRVLTCGADRKVQLWNLQTGKIIRTFGPMADPVHAIAFRRDYTQVAVASGKIVKIWNVNDGKDLRTLEHPNTVLDLVFNSNHTRMVTACADKKTRVWDLTTGKEMQAFLHEGVVRSVDFHPNNVNVIGGGDDKTASIHTIRLTRMVEASKESLTDLSINSNGVYLFSAHKEKMVKRWNTGNGTSDRSYLSSEAVECVAANRANTLVAQGSSDQMVRLYDFNDSRLLASFKAPAKLKRLDFSYNSQALVAACEDGTVQTWNVTYTRGRPLPTEFGKPLQSFRHQKKATDVMFARDSVHFYSSGEDQTVKEWKFASSSPVRTFNHSRYVDAVSFSPDGKILATTGHDGQVRLWDVENGRQTRAIAAHTKPAINPVYALAWNPDGKMLASGSYDKSIKIWNPTNGALIREIKAYKVKTNEKGHRNGIYCLRFSPDGKLIVSGSSDNVVKLWNVADGKWVRDFVNPKLMNKSHPGAIYGARFADGGSRLITAGRAPLNQGYLAVWNVADGKLVKGESLAIGPIFGLALSPDGKSLALGTGSLGRFAPPGSDDVNVSYLLNMP